MDPSYLSFEKQHFTSLENSKQRTGGYEFFLVFVNDAGHLTKCFTNSIQNHVLFNGKDTFTLNDLRTIRCTTDRETLKIILEIVTDKALDRRDRHSDEYVREIHDERLREIIKEQNRILITVIPEPFKVWAATTHGPVMGLYSLFVQKEVLYL